MLPELPICPCCTAALLHTVLQSGTNLVTPQPLLELGKGALLRLIQLERPADQQPVIRQESML